MRYWYICTRSSTGRRKNGKLVDGGFGVWGSWFRRLDIVILGQRGISMEYQGTYSGEHSVLTANMVITACKHERSGHGELPRGFQSLLQH